MLADALNNTKKLEKFNVTKNGFLAQRVRAAPATAREYRKWSDPHLKRRLRNNQTFAHHFWEDWHTMRQFLEVHPELYFDFQFLVDDEMGYIYQIDLDRAHQFLTSDMENKEEYLKWKKEEIDELEKELMMESDGG